MTAVLASLGHGLKLSNGKSAAPYTESLKLAKLNMLVRQLRREVDEAETLTDVLDPPNDINTGARHWPTTGKFKMRSVASFNREICQLRLRVIALDQRLKRKIGAAAFAVFEDDFPKTVEQDADTTNVVRLR